METISALSRKEQVIRHAAELFMEKGYAASSMRDLAQKMGIEAASLYSHIRSKEEILQHLCFDMAAEFRKSLYAVEKQNVPRQRKTSQRHRGPHQSDGQRPHGVGRLHERTPPPQPALPAAGSSPSHQLQQPVQAMGLRQAGIRQLFMTEGVLLGFAGAVSGVVLALLISMTVNALGLEWLPPGSAEPLPLVLRVWGETVTIVGVTLGLIVVAVASAWYPAYRAAQLKVVDALRHA